MSRRSKSFVALICAFGLALTSGCGGSESEVVDSSVPRATTTTFDPAVGDVVAWWPMTDTGGTEMADSSGNGHTGVVGDRVERTGESFRFPPVTQGVADVARIVVVPPAPDFISDDESLTISFRIRTTSQGEHNIVQKGQSQAKGGFWKVEVNANGDTPGIAHCTFKGAISASAVSAEARIDDGKWHSVACRRTRLGLAIDVDGAVHSKSALTGAMTNTAPLSIAGKSRCAPENGVECDYFVGELADLRIATG
jgi:hypothetical protein